MSFSYNDFSQSWMLRDTCDLKHFQKVQVIQRTFSRQSTRIMWGIVSRGMLTVLTSDTQRDERYRKRWCNEKAGKSENKRANVKEWIREEEIKKKRKIMKDSLNMSQEGKVRQRKLSERHKEIEWATVNKIKR